MANYDISVSSTRCDDNVDLEKGMALVMDSPGDSQTIQGLSSPTATVVDNMSNRKESNRIRQIAGSSDLDR
jgi:hypothetical protein